MHFFNPAGNRYLGILVSFVGGSALIDVKNLISVFRLVSLTIPNLLNKLRRTRPCHMPGQLSIVNLNGLNDCWLDKLNCLSVGVLSSTYIPFGRTIPFG